MLQPTLPLLNSAPFPLNRPDSCSGRAVEEEGTVKSMFFGMTPSQVAKMYQKHKTKPLFLEVISAHNVHKLSYSQNPATRSYFEPINLFNTITYSAFKI
jgi:hypothetical protein